MYHLLGLELVSYGVAATAYLAFVASGRAGLLRAARIALLVAVLAHVVDIGWHCTVGQNPASSSAEAMAFVSFLMAGGYLVASRRRDLAAVGAFITPAVLILLLLARIVPSPSAPGEPLSTLGIVHVFLATLGLAIFAIGAALATLYLFSERRMRQKDWSRPAARGAALETLDRFAARSVNVGFPVFTVALVTGAIWIARLGGVGAALRAEHVLAIAAWIAYGALLLARVGAGWRGRKAAWLALAGFAGALSVLIIYLLRQAG